MDMFQAISGRHSVHDLSLPAEWVAVSPIIVGHPKNPAAPVPRNPPEIRWID